MCKIKCVCGSSSVGRASAFQAGCREFESRLPLIKRVLRSSLFLSMRKTASHSCLLSQTEFYSRVSCLVRLTCKTSSFVTKSLFAYDASESRLPLIKKDWVHSQSFLIYAKIETRTLSEFERICTLPSKTIQ